MSKRYRILGQTESQSKNSKAVKTNISAQLGLSSYPAWVVIQTNIALLILLFAPHTHASNRWHSMHSTSRYLLMHSIFKC